MMLGLWPLAQARARLSAYFFILFLCVPGALSRLKFPGVLQAGVMFANGLAVLNNERFLEKSVAPLPC
jgi:hypothetical protein